MTLASKSGVGVDFLAFLKVENGYSLGNPPSLLSQSEPSYASSLVYTEFSVPRMLIFVFAARRKLVGDYWLTLSSSSAVIVPVPRFLSPTPRLTGFIKLSISLTWPDCLTSSRDWPSVSLEPVVDWFIPSYAISLFCGVLLCLEMIWDIVVCGYETADISCFLCVKVKLLRLALSILD